MGDIFENVYEHPYNEWDLQQDDYGLGNRVKCARCKFPCVIDRDGKCPLCSTINYDTHLDLTGG